MYRDYNVTDYNVKFCRKDIASPPVLYRELKRERFLWFVGIRYAVHV